MTFWPAHFFCPCPRGLEAHLAEEISELGGHNVATEAGGVACDGPFELAWRINLHSRLASRVLWRLKTAAYRSEEDVYKAAIGIEWPALFDVSRTFMVRVEAIKSPLRSLDFVTLKIKDAVCDRFRRAGGSRPSIDTKTPDVRVHAFLTRDQVTLYLDTTGASLFQRGWRKATNEAPLRENLAAGMLKIAGWAPGTPLLDPMCGSGTLLVEAAMTALDWAPGLNRAFGFERLSNFNQDAWTGLREAARAAQKPATPLAIYGSDRFGEALKAARLNLDALGLGECIALKQVNFIDLAPPAPEGILLTNPPYGVRLGERAELEALYPQIGDTLKKKFAGWQAWLLTADPQLLKGMRLSPSRKVPLFNGALECRLVHYAMVAGSNRRERPEAAVTDLK